MNRHRAGNVANGYLMCQLLDLHLLELDELATTRLHVKSAGLERLLTLNGWAVQNGHVRSACHVLVYLEATLIASQRGHQQQWLYFSDSRYDSLNGYQLANMRCSDHAEGDSLLLMAQRHDLQFTGGQFGG